MSLESSLSLYDPVVVASLGGLAVGFLVLALGVARSIRVPRSDRQQTLDLVARFSGRVTHSAATHPHRGDQGSMWTQIADSLATKGQRERTERLLAYAGRQGGTSVERVSVAVLQWAFLGALVGLLLGLWFGATAPVVWWLVPVLAVGGYVLPNIRLRREARRRSEELRLALPEALDLLNLCVGAGLGLQGALQQVARHQRGPVAAEFTRVLQEMSLGVPRSDALLAMARRVQQEDVLRFVYALIQVDRLGIPLSMVMSEQAREMRARRRASAREDSQQVSVKILMPLVVCFLPGLFVIVVGPALISIWRLLTT